MSKRSCSGGLRSCLARSSRKRLVNESCSPSRRAGADRSFSSETAGALRRWFGQRQVQDVDRLLVRTTDAVRDKAMRRVGYPVTVTLIPRTVVAKGTSRLSSIKVARPVCCSSSS